MKKKDRNKLKTNGTLRKNRERDFQCEIGGGNQREHLGAMTT